jgi:hypothetical protein
MKNLLVIAAMLCAFVACKDDAKKNDASIVYNPRTAQEGTTMDVHDLGALTFTDTLHNFGKIKEGEVVEYAFAYKNTGKRAVLINSARASCGCTASEYKTTEIAVGETGEIKVKFNSEGKQGVQEKTVFISTNGYPSDLRLIIQAEVQ